MQFTMTHPIINEVTNLFEVTAPDPFFSDTPSVLFSGTKDDASSSVLFNVPFPTVSPETDVTVEEVLVVVEAGAVLVVKLSPVRLAVVSFTPISTGGAIADGALPVEIFSGT
jgi:hypothetical protein